MVVSVFDTKPNSKELYLKVQLNKKIKNNNNKNKKFVQLKRFLSLLFVLKTMVYVF